MDAELQKTLSFSDWINSHALVDLQLTGASSFTWPNHQNPPIMSRLDRFLVSSEWMDVYSDAYQLAFMKPASGRYPIMLGSKCERWGPNPFRFELIWLEEKEFLQLIAEWWKELQLKGWPGHRLAFKLKLLKVIIKDRAEAIFGDVGRHIGEDSGIGQKRGSEPALYRRGED